MKVVFCDDSSSSTPRAVDATPVRWQKTALSPVPLAFNFTTIALILAFWILPETFKTFNYLLPLFNFSFLLQVWMPMLGFPTSEGYVPLNLNLYSRNANPACSPHRMHLLNGKCFAPELGAFLITGDVLKFEGDCPRRVPHISERGDLAQQIAGREKSHICRRIQIQIWIFRVKSKCSVTHYRGQEERKK